MSHSVGRLPFHRVFSDIGKRSRIAGANEDADYDEWSSRGGLTYLAAVGRRAASYIDVSHAQGATKRYGCEKQYPQS